MITCNYSFIAVFTFVIMVSTSFKGKFIFMYPYKAYKFFIFHLSPLIYKLQIWFSLISEALQLEKP
jgi:hypothetical protein